MRPFLSLTFHMVLSRRDRQVEVPTTAVWSNDTPLSVALMLRLTIASQALVGMGGRLKGGGGAGPDGVRMGVGGAGGLEGIGLFNWERLTALPFPFSGPDGPLAPLEIGHQCLFAALCDANLRPHDLHCCCGRPSLASLAAFWHSRLNAWFLLHASHRFSFWAWVASLWPFTRLKKDKGPSPLSSSNKYMNITCFTLWRG
jgi:hypothetical protein